MWLYSFIPHGIACISTILPALSAWTAEIQMSTMKIFTGELLNNLNTIHSINFRIQGRKHPQHACTSDTILVKLYLGVNRL